MHNRQKTFCTLSSPLSGIFKNFLIPLPGALVCNSKYSRSLSLYYTRHSRGATGPFQQDLPLQPRPTPNTRFRPDFDLIRTFLLRDGFGGGRGRRATSGWDPVTARKVLTRLGLLHGHFCKGPFAKDLFFQSRTMAGSVRHRADFSEKQSPPLKWVN